MELNDRINVLVQSAQIAQKNGTLSLDDAVIVKYAISNIEKNEKVKYSVDILTKVATQAQSRGAYTLKDAYLIYTAIDGIESLIPNDDDENQSPANEDSEQIYY